MPGYSCIVCHVNMHCSAKTYSHFCIKHLAEKAKKERKISGNSPKNKEIKLPRKLWNVKTCLKWGKWREKRTRNVKKRKRALLPEPRVICWKVSFLTDILIILLIKVLKKPPELAYMSDYSCIVCHVNMYCSGTTYSHFCIKRIAKSSKKFQIMPKFPQKQRKTPLREPSIPENMLKMTQARSRKPKISKNTKRFLVRGDNTPRTKTNLLETFVSIRYSNYFVNKKLKNLLNMTKCLVIPA